MTELDVAPPSDPAPLDEAVVLSSEWLTAVLGARWPGAVVTGTEVVERLQTVATKTRFRVDYADPGGDAPRALCVKGYFDPALGERVAAGKVEVAFYRQVAPGLDVRTPPCVHAAVDDATGHGLLLMEDLKVAGNTFLTPLTPFRAEQSAATLDQLARLHAAWWDRPADAVPGGFGPRLPWLARLGDPAFLQAQLDDGRADGVPDEARRGERLAGAMAALGSGAVDVPACLVHGDLHAGNVYETAGGDIGLIDWQVIQHGPWALDVAYHVASALEPDERRRSERGLLDHYRDRLAAHGVTPPGREAAWNAYRACLAYGYFMWGITRLVDRPIINRLTHRLGTAVADHGSFDLLGVWSAPAAARLRVGLVVGGDPRPVAALEALPIDSLWVGGHVASRNPSPEPMVALARLSAVAERVEIGTAVLQLPLYPPAVVAKQAADIDRATGGRLVLGVGVGGEYPQEYRACEVPIEERGPRADEAIPLLRALWSAEEVTHRGRFHTLEDVRIHPAPARPGGPPIVVGGRRGPAMRRAATLGDGWMPYLYSPRRYAASVATVRAAAAAAGRDLDGFGWYAWVFVNVDPSGDVARQELARSIGGLYRRDVRALVDNVAAAGTAAEVTATLKAFVDAGARHLVLCPATADGDGEPVVRRLVDEVLPAVRAHAEALPAP